MYFSYAVVQAEQPKSFAEQRAEDLRRGEMALALSRLLRRGRIAGVPASSGPTLPVSSSLGVRLACD